MRRGWWVFDLPLIRDPLFVVGVVVGAAAIVRVIVDADRFGATAFVIMLVTAVPQAFLVIGVVLGSIREFHRGRGEGVSSSASPRP